MGEPKGGKDAGRPRGPGAEPGAGAPGAAGTREERMALLPDLFRRALTLGLSGIFTTEEAFRRALGDTLPRDWVDFAVDQSERTRAEFAQRMASEMARVLESMDLEEILKRTLAENRIEIKAEIKLVPESGASSRSARPKGRVSAVGGARGGSRE